MTSVLFTVPGRPIPKGRPRSGQGTTYTPKRTTEAEHTVAGYAMAARVNARVGVFNEPLGVRLVFVIPDRRSLADIDNLAKLILDACNNVLWTDDQLIVHLDIHRLIDPESEGSTRIEVWTQPDRVIG